MQTTSNTLQQTPPRTSIAGKEPDLDLIAPLCQVIFRELPGLKEPIVNLLTEAVGKDAWLQAVARDEDRERKCRTEERLRSLPHVKKIRMTKREFMEMCSQCWTHAPDREFVKRWAGTMFHFVLKQIDEQDSGKGVQS